MLRNMTWVSFLEWVAYDEVEPFGERRADLRNGLMCATIANCHRDSTRSKPFKATDFIIDFDPDTSNRAKRGERAPVTDRQTWEGIKAIAKAMATPENPPRRKSTPAKPTP